MRARKRVSKMTKQKHRGGIIGIILMAVVIVMNVESVAPAAAIGPSQFFWWGFLLVFFFLPYGLITSELSATFTSAGGLYDWIKLAFGKKWGGRLAWYYLINFPLWMTSLAILSTTVCQQVIGHHFSTNTTVVLQLVFIWLVIWIGNLPLADSTWLLKVAAVAKEIIILSLAILGIHLALTRGIANHLTLTNMLPSPHLASLNNLSVILFNFVGFEVLSSLSSTMANPARQIPEAITISGILIAILYVAGAFGMSAAIPYGKLSASAGLMDAFALMIGSWNWFVKLIGGLFMFVLLVEMVSWVLGIEYVTRYAAIDCVLPQMFARRDHHGRPIGTGIFCGVIASWLVLIAPIIPNRDVFTSFFSLNVVAMLMCYALMFPAFWQLRRRYPATRRPFRVPGGPVITTLMAVVPELILLTTLVLTTVPFPGPGHSGKVVIFFGTIVMVIMGEVVIVIGQHETADHPFLLSKTVDSKRHLISHPMVIPMYHWHYGKRLVPLKGKRFRHGQRRRPRPNVIRKRP